jgi:hypothetical protein
MNFKQFSPARLKFFAKEQARTLRQIVRRSPQREIVTSGLFLCVLIFIALKLVQPDSGTNTSPLTDTSFMDNFTTPQVIAEASDFGSSTSPYWWVDSGAQFIIENGTARTLLGSLPKNDTWRTLYAKDNPADTDNGYHPQNIFRLVTTSQWNDYTEETYFKIVGNNYSTSNNRNESNGLLLFNRYQDADNLYYAGIRVDGTAVIKKKFHGTYYTMAQTTIFSGTYDPVHAKNLLPQNTWIGLRTEVTTATSTGNPVTIKLLLDVGRTGNWLIATQAVDDGKQYGGGIITGPAHLGIRTDFMDVLFSDFHVQKE